MVGRESSPSPAQAPPQPAQAPPTVGGSGDADDFEEEDGTVKGRTKSISEQLAHVSLCGLFYFYGYVTSYKVLLFAHVDCIFIGFYNFFLGIIVFLILSSLIIFKLKHSSGT